MKSKSSYRSRTISTASRYNTANIKFEVYPNVQILVVAGGGSGGYGTPNGFETGGGGAGGLIYIQDIGLLNQYNVTNDTFTITVGAGGVSSNGSNSEIISGNYGTAILTAIGGGKGANGSVGGNPGGSGGGGSHPQTAGGTSIQTTQPTISAESRTYGFGRNGSQGWISAGGSGGGAGGQGQFYTPGVGGVGLRFDVTGPWPGVTGTSNIYYAGGGSATGINPSPNVGGGLGGGGAAVGQGGGPRNANTNSGGGGGGTNTNSSTGGAGGSGIVIIRHSNNYANAIVTGSPNVFYSNANVVYRFWQSGTIKFLPNLVVTNNQFTSDLPTYPYPPSPAPAPAPSPSPGYNLSYLLAGGGGGGGSDYYSGGGGGAEVIEVSNTSIELNTSYAIVVGTGGNRSSGSNTTFLGNVAIGGGLGGGGNTAGSIGASGGGGGYSSVGGAGTTGKGYPGGRAGSAGNQNAYDEAGGGGGGAGGGGGNATTSLSVGGSAGGNGGIGYGSSISGNISYYGAGGGGGTIRSSIGGSGGSNVGGRGYGLYSSATPGTPGTGSGGGGGGWSSPTSTILGGTGGSGVAIIKIPNSYFSNASFYVSTTGNPTITYPASDTVYTFTNSGTIAFRIGTRPKALPNVNFSANVTTIIPGSAIRFTNSSNTLSNINLYEWDFDNNNVVENTGYFLGNITAVYNTPGTYSVKLTVTNETGASSATASNLIRVVPPIPITYLVVAGGGGGAGDYDSGGGGGGGGLIYAPQVNSVTDTTYTITVGAGGPAGSGQTTSGSRGGDSNISISGTNVYRTYGGGGGGIQGSNSTSNGGSGGGQGGAGSGTPSASKGIGVYPGSSYVSDTSQGNDGGTSVNLDSGGSAGGGGGAGGIGANAATNLGGNGGIGKSYDITGTGAYYAGGGGGGTRGPTGGTGGSGGGGTGGNNAIPATSGNVNTGGGGGGGGLNLFNFNTLGSGGGSGVVIVSHPSGYANATVTGSPNVTATLLSVIYRFWQSGTIRFSNVTIT